MANDNGRKRKPGRPRSGDAPEVNWIDVDRRLVYGEIHIWPDGSITLHYPKIHELAARYDVTAGTIGTWSSKRKCMKRRAEAKAEYHEDQLYEMAREDGRVFCEAKPENVNAEIEGLQSFGIAVRQPTTKEGKLPAFAVPSAEIERLLVHGEPISCGDAGWRIRYPRYKELADRYNTTVSVINGIAVSGNCAARRKESQAVVRQGVDDNMIALRIEAETEQQSRILDIVNGFIEKFEENLRNGVVVATSVADLERIVRIRERLVSDALAREMDAAELTLQELQNRYQRTLDESSTARNVTGEVGEAPGTSEPVIDVPAELES